MASEANDRVVGGDGQLAGAAQGSRREASGGEQTSREAALFLSAFVDELVRCGVREVVVSPGSRSTPLAMVAYASPLELYLNVDERGAAFFALGLAKASGRPVCLVCTSGTAVANYYPAVMEAEASRVPLLLLTADRPPRLWGLGAPQTCDQLNAYGSHVRMFRQMPLPGDGPAQIAFARQSAREAFCAAAGAVAARAAGAGAARGCLGAAGPVQLNFPFDNPLKPDLAARGLFEVGRSELASEGALGAGESRGDEGVGTPCGVGAASCGASGLLGPVVDPTCELTPGQARALLDLVRSRDTLILAGEGSVSCAADARELLALAEELALPIVADPLSGLRAWADPHVLSAYDEVFGSAGQPRGTRPELVIRFGRYPVSKACATHVCAPGAPGGTRAAQVVIDAVETRDFNVATDVFVRCDPPAFVRALRREVAREAGDAKGAGGSARPETAEAGEAGTPGAPTAAGDAQRTYLRAWRAADDTAAAVLEERARQGGDGFEGAYVRRLLELIPDGSLLWAASSMSIRALDQFWRAGAVRPGATGVARRTDASVAADAVASEARENERGGASTRTPHGPAVLCNRGLNGIDGTLSSALGAAQLFDQTTLLIGDLALLHDLNAFHLQRELTVHHGHGEAGARSIVVVLLNNQGGGIFDLLPQSSPEPYFERLFLTPQRVDFSCVAAAFGVPYRRATTLAAFADAYRALLATPGISLLEVPFALAGTRERYRHV